MDDAHALPNDLAECQRLLLAAFQRAAELSRVLEETAASYGELQATHQAALEELSALKRWIYGRRTEKLVEGEGQRHLFDLEPSDPSAPPLEPTPELPPRPASPRRRRRELDLDKLPHYRHEHDLSEADKQCSGCGRAQRPHRPGREPSSGVRAGEARSARLCATQVRLPALPRRRGKPAAAGAADCSRHRRTGADRADRRRQVRRPPAAVPSGRLLHAPRPAHRSQHAVRLGASGGGTVAAALRAAERVAAAVARAVDRRHARDVALVRTRREPHGPLLDLHRRRASLLRL